MDRYLHRILLKSLVGVVGLPIVIAVTVGVSALLASVGDRVAARVGAFVALAAGAAWVIVVVSAIVSASLAVLSLDADQRHLRRQHRRNERRRSRES